MRRWYWAGIAVLALSLAGCAEAPSGKETGHPAALLADGNVTYDEYQAAFRAYSACLREAGYELLIQAEDNQTIKFSIPSGAVDSGVDAECYEKEFAAIDAAWQIARIDTSESARILRTCLEDLGIAPADTYAEMNEQLFGSGNDPSVCVG